jgi:polyhydroxybutyrate depolymerase
MQPGITEFTMRVGESLYEVRVFIPSGASPDAPLPTVLVFHGGGGSGTGLAEVDGFEDLAESEGFAVVHPSADPAWPMWAIEDADHPERPDVAFAEQLIDTLITDWRADAARIYAVGWSIGGTFSARLAREIPERLAGIGAAGQIAVAPQLGDPPLPMPLIQINGTDDPVIPFDGSAQTIATGAPDSWRWMLATAIPEAFHAGALRRGCTSEPTVFNVSDDVVGYRYPGCDGDVEMLRYEIIGGGHVWPGGVPSSSEMGSTTSNLSGASAMWDFLRPYSR